MRAAAAGSPLTAADAGRVAAICRGLDGMALAIELTAARVPSLGLDGIEAGLADRMNLLTGGRRADDRHRSLRSALDWSYALLDEADRAVLRRISVFAAPFTAAAAQTLCAGWPPAAGDAVPAALARLAEQSLLVAVGGPVRDPLPRPGDHPPVRRRPAGRGRRGRSGFGPPPGLVPGRRRRPRAASRATTGPGGRRSTSWPTSCAPRCAGRRLAPSAGRRRTGWRSRWPSCASPAVCPASRSGGTSRPRGSRRTPATRPPRCAAPRARPSPGTSATTRSGCSWQAADAAVRAGDGGRRGRGPGRGGRDDRPRAWG